MVVNRFRPYFFFLICLAEEESWGQLLLLFCYSVGVCVRVSLPRDLMAG